MLWRCLILSVVACAWLGMPGISPAEDQPAATQDPIAEWDSLVAEMEKVKTQMDELKLQFAKGTPQEKGKIRTEMQVLVNRFSTKTLPRLKELAPIVFEKSPDNTVAASFMLEDLMSENKYQDVIKVATAILKAEPKNNQALFMNGQAKFAEHDFEGAITDLTILEQSGSSGGRATDLLEASKKYIDLWKAEQAIRAKEEALTGDQALPLVKLSTNQGEIEILLFEDEAPVAVRSFVQLIEAKYYDGLRFHRVIPSFMAQGGCPNSREGSTKQPGSGGPGYTIKCECYQENARMHFAGSLSMAHAGRDSGGSQFFLTHLPTAHLNAEKGKDEGCHTVFGRVTKGLDIVRALGINDVIKSATVIRKRSHPYVLKREEMTPSLD